LVRCFFFLFFVDHIKRSGAGIKESLLQHIKSAGSGHGSPANSPRRSCDAPKHSRRHRSTDASVLMDSPCRDSPGSARHTRRQRNSINGKDLPSQDLPAVPKQSRRRKSKGGGSIKSSRSKDQNSLPDIHFTDVGSDSGSGHGLMKSNDQNHLINSVLEKEGVRI